jgi:hypothetical protein
MGEILGIGVTHWPKFAAVEQDMADTLRRTLEDPGIPLSMREPAGWPNAMQAEWEDPLSAERHHQALEEGFRTTRAAIDDFEPDVVLIWGDDQYENFAEDVVPAFSVLAYDDIEIRPWRNHGLPNRWGEPPETTFTVRGARDVGRLLATKLIERDFDVAYAYRPLHHDGLAHAFANTVLFLDQDRIGFPYPVVALPINCYGRRVISHRGRASRFADSVPAEDPPSPSPRRCMNLGRATVQALLETDLRAVLVASSSWSHAFLVESNWHLWPDVEADHSLYEALAAGRYEVWEDRSLAMLEDSGQHEMLNWYCLVGAMDELGRVPTWSSHVPTYVYNSTKTFAIFAPS